MPSPKRAQIRSFEQLLLLSATAIEGTDHADWLTVCGQDAVINAHGGDDQICAPTGTNQIDGGAGNDILYVYEGKQSDFILQKRPDGSVLLEGVGLNNEWVSNTLTSVERISFRDGMVWVGDNAERTLNGTRQNDFLSGSEFTDLIQAFAGDDAIYAPFNVQTIDGGAGLDTLIVYEGRLADYDVTVEDDGVRIQGPGLNGEQIDNLLVNVERILFNDRLLDLRELAVDQPSAAPETDASAPSPASDQQDAGRQQAADGWAADEPSTDVPAPDIPPADAAPATDDAPSPAESSTEPPEPTGPVPSSPPPASPDAASGGLDSAPEMPDSGDTPASQTPSDENTADSQPAIEPPPAVPDEPPSDNPLVSPVPEFVQEVVDLTNEFRARNGLNLLSISYELQQAAQSHSRDLAVSDYFSHTGLDGRQPWDRAFDEGYNYQTIGENIAAGQLTPQQVVQAWINSPPHLANLMNDAFTEIGVGYDFLGEDTGNINYQHYWTQLFGTEL
ncbi:MAG: CAP domain-containing protein [Planctomycetaceae bacterium]|nr:CAP domain-containing protein [Planctomycetaceae bacterium]